VLARYSPVMKVRVFRKVFPVLAILLVIFLGAFISATAKAATFADTENVQYKESINFLKDRGYVEGYEDGTFRPYDAIKRGEMIKLITTMLHSDAIIGQGTDCFMDVKKQWFSRFVCFAKNRNIVQGRINGKFFAPANSVAMAEGLKMGIEAFDMKITPPAKGQKWYKPYVEFAHKNNIFSKYSYLPGAEMSREKMAHLMHQLILIDEGTKPISFQRDPRSAGCGRTPPGKVPTSSVVNGINRTYITVVPNAYSKDEPIKLVFAFHGRTNPNTMVRTYYKVEEAAKGKAIFIYPSGLSVGSGRSWADGGDKADDLRDYELFDHLYWKFTNEYCINVDEVYVVGHSLGAWFTNSLACNRADVIRGIGSLGGGTAWGNCTGPVAAMVWHNPKDRLAPFGSGERARDQMLAQNQCSFNTKPIQPSSGSCVEYQGCGEYSPVIWCPHRIDNASWDGRYYPHNWPRITGPSIWSFLDGLPG
jgi:polyhydroxybutyrate depolymerase